jgi:hypothetical protein
MGYDLIESGDFFPQSRLRSNFSDDKNYREFLGIGRGKRRARGEAKNVEEMFPDLDETATCKDVENRIVEVQAEMDVQRGKVTAGDKSKWFRMSLGKLETKLAQANTLLSKLKCKEIAEQQELNQQKSEILSTLSVTTAESSNKKTGDKIGGMNKYLVYGIGGFFVIGAVIILLKPSKV